MEWGGVGWGLGGRRPTLGLGGFCQGVIESIVEVQWSEISKPWEPNMLCKKQVGFFMGVTFRQGFVERCCRSPGILCLKQLIDG